MQNLRLSEIGKLVDTDAILVKNILILLHIARNSENIFNPRFLNSQMFFLQVLLWNHEVRVWRRKYKAHVKKMKLGLDNHSIHWFHSNFFFNSWFILRQDRYLFLKDMNTWFWCFIVLTCLKASLVDECIRVQGFFFLYFLKQLLMKCIIFPRLLRICILVAHMFSYLL